MSRRELSLAEAVAQYLATLSPELRQESQQELNRFVRWYGGGRLISGLNVQEIAGYAEGLSSSSEAAKRLKLVKSFLTYVKKEGLTGTNLAAHLRLGSSSERGRVKLKQGAKSIPSSTLTAEGYATLKSELTALKQERPHLAEEIRRAAADKDFRENAPLEAAKEQQGHTEARIRELETILKAATIAGRAPLDTAKVELGCVVTLCALDSEEELHYTLVNPNEAEPASGKLSITSPMGKALLAKAKGDVVEVAAPMGTLRYRIEEIKHQT